MHYTIYRTSMQLLQDAVQQLMLVPLDEMEEFLVALMEASGTETELEQRKMKAAEGQLALIRLSREFSGGIRRLLADS
jgi:phage-related protein